MIAVPVPAFQLPALDLRRDRGRKRADVHHPLTPGSAETSQSEGNRYEEGLLQAAGAEPMPLVFNPHVADPMAAKVVAGDDSRVRVQ